MPENTPQKSNTVLYVGIGCAVVLFIIPILGVIASIAIPGFISHQHKAKQAEAFLILQQIRDAEIAYEASTSSYVEAIFYPSFVPTQDKQPWVIENSGEFKRLNWSPEGEVRGVYSVTTTSNLDFRAVGMMDIDGDGNYATFVATKSTAPYAITAPDVY